MKLRQYLQENQITQARFGAMLSPPANQALVWQWLAGKTRVKLERAIQIHRITGGAVSLEEIASMYGAQEETEESA